MIKTFPPYVCAESVKAGIIGSSSNILVVAILVITNMQGIYIFYKLTGWQEKPVYKPFSKGSQW